MRLSIMKALSSVFIVTICITSLAAEKEQNEQRPNNVKTQASKNSQLLGMSVTGNKESPRSLTIVPWRDPEMNGKSPTITPVWQPTLKLLDPESYRRNVNLFLRQRQQNANQ